jgi:hypothetical protein
MRYAIAIGVIAIALAGAVYVHQRHITRTIVVATSSSGLPYAQTGYSEEGFHPAWEDPVAVLIALGGLAVAVGVVATGRHG